MSASKCNICGIGGTSTANCCEKSIRKKEFRLAFLETEIEKLSKKLKEYRKEYKKLNK